MTEAYQFAASQANQQIACVVKFNFTTPIYVTSHTVSGITGTVFQGALIPKGAISQRLNPDDSRAEIGSISFDVLDTGITGELKSRLDSGEGLKRVVVEVYRGGLSDDFADFQKIQTQIIENQVTIGNSRYRFSCSDIQRSLKKEIFDVAKTNLGATFGSSDTTLTVISTDGFEPCPHTSSFSDAPGQSVYYLKIKDGDKFEVVRATGKTATTFTGITRGLFFTTATTFAYEAGETAENQIEVEEYVYLEMPVPALAYALLTGQIINGGTLPSKWHLGIDPTWIDLDQFQNAGTDWFDPNDYTKGMIYRFEGIEKTEGKRFIEQELLRLIAFMPINADGQLGFKRISRIIENSDYKAILDPSNVIKHSDLKYNLSKTTNVIDLKWGYVDVPERTKGFTRQNILYDSTSVSTHGGEHWKKLSMRGLHNSRHTKTVIQNLFHAYRDRYSNPPFELSLDLLPTVFNLQIGETVKVQLPNLKDPVTDAPLDRTFEIQRVSTDLVSGKVKVELFASSGEASILTDDDAGDPAELPDGWYPTQGTDASTILSVDGAGILTADGQLNGNASTRTWFYYLGDLTIPNGRTLTIDKNVGLAVRGHLQIDGTIKAQGGGATSYIGSTEGGGALYTGGGPRDGIGQGLILQGKNATLPALTIENNAGVIAGIPDDTGGTPGAPGGGVLNWVPGDATYEPLVSAAGGGGGLGGGGLVIVSRGCGLGVVGLFDVSGADGNAGSISGNYQGGSGGGGAPGSVVVLIDGNTNPYPILNGKVKAEFGTSPNGSALNRGGRGKAATTIDLGTNNARVMFVPASRDPYPDYGTGSDDDAGGNTSHFFKQATQPTDADAQAAVNRNLISGDEWLSTQTWQRFTFDGSTWGVNRIAWDDVEGDGKPEDNANNYTAVWGSNIGNQPPDSDVLNANQLWNEISGTGKPEDNATVGAIWGTNITGQPNDNDILNSVIEARLDAAVIYQAAQPSSADVGDVWVNSSNNQMWIYRSTGWQAVGNSQQITSANASTFIASGAIGNAQIGNAAIGSANIQDAAITNAKIANAAITSAKIQNAAITNAHVSNLAADKLIAGTIGAYSLYLGNTKFHLDGTNRRIDIQDNAGQLRTRIGYDGADYGFELYNGSGVKLFDADGNAILAATSQVEDGVNYRSIARGVEHGTARDGDSVTFPLAWDAPPIVKFVGGGLSYSSSLTGDQFQHLQALNISTTGFTVSAKLKELAGATTNRTDNTLITSGTYTWEIHKSDALEAFDDNYTFKFDATVYSVWNAVDQMWDPGFLTIELYTNDGGGWIKRKTVSLNSFGQSSKSFTESHVITVDGLTNHAGREFAIHVASDTYSNSSISNQRVEYTTAAAPASTSATPSGAPDLQYIVIGG